MKRKLRVKCPFIVVDGYCQPPNYRVSGGGDVIETHSKPRGQNETRVAEKQNNKIATSFTFHRRAQCPHILVIINHHAKMEMGN